MRKTLASLAVALSLTATVAPAQDYPAYDINGIIQWAAGGAVDTVARAAAAIAEQELGRKIVMTNRTGGAGVIATRHVLSQPADGYTLLFGSADPQLYKVMGLADVDYNDFYPVSLLVEEENVIMVNADAPYDSFPALLEAVKSRPGELRMGTYGPGTNAHIVGTMLPAVTEFDVNMVPFDGAGPAMTATLGGALDVVVAGISVAKPMIDSGRLRALALVAEQPNPQLPDVSAITEHLPEMERYLPWGSLVGTVLVHGETPDEAKARLTEAFTVVGNNPQFREMMETRGLRMVNISGDEATAYLNRWQSVTSWLLHDAGETKKSPEDFGIPKP